MSDLKEKYDEEYQKPLDELNKKSDDITERIRRNRSTVETSNARALLITFVISFIIFVISNNVFKIISLLVMILATAEACRLLKNLKLEKLSKA